MKIALPWLSSGILGLIFFHESLQEGRWGFVLGYLTFATICLSVYEYKVRN